MNDLFIERTNNTPEVKLNHEKGSITFHGRMIPFEGYTFFKPILDWVGEYTRNPQQKTIFKIFSDSVNTTSAKAVMMIFKDLDKIRDYGKDVEITWYYKDDEDLEDWKAYTEFFEELNFNFIEVDSDPVFD